MHEITGSDVQFLPPDHQSIDSDDRQYHNTQQIHVPCLQADEVLGDMHHSCHASMDLSMNAEPDI